ncbi:MAG TPA: AraC family transcriptional regulator [Capsulimonadaceae bacterium]|jgi:AraC-like DNA-binding protein
MSYKKPFMAMRDDGNEQPSSIYEEVGAGRPHAVGERILHDRLGLPPEVEGRLWRHVYRGPIISRHLHEEVEMNLAVRGSAAYLVGKRRYTLTPGTMIWLFPRQDHILIDQSADFRCWILVARPALSARLAGRDKTYRPLTEDDPAGVFARQVEPETVERLIGLYHTVGAFEDSGVCYNAGIEHAAAASWTTFLSAGEAKETRLHPAVERAVQLLRDDTDEMTVDQLAGETGLSASRLSRLFHAQVGIPIARFRNAQRLDRFNRLRDSAPSLAAAALDAGFGSYAQFYRVFREAYGCGPAER